MHPFRGRPACVARARLDPELMDFDMPKKGAHRWRGQPVEQRVAGRKDRTQGGMRADPLGYRLEPALEPAIDRVVVAALVMRLMRLSGDPLGAGAETREAAAAVTPAIGHVAIDPEIVPAPRKIIPIGEPGSFQDRAHLGLAHDSKPRIGDGLGDRGEPVGHHSHVDPPEHAVKWRTASGQSSVEAGFSLMQRNSRQYPKRLLGRISRTVSPLSRRKSSSGKSA